MPRQRDRIYPKYKGISKNYGTQGSKKLRCRLYPCDECKSMNTRINVYYTRLKCFDCGTTSKFEEDSNNQKAIWYDLLKLEDI